MQRTTLAILIVGVSLAGGTLWFKFHQTGSSSDLPALLSRFPAENSTVLSIDFAALRHAGLLVNSRMAEEPEYKQFLEGTGFDYKRDLDSLVASFSKSGSFFIAQGRFNWKKLRDYATSRGGSCYEQLCRVQGSVPERHISFLPLHGLHEDAIALAVGTDDLAAAKLANPGEPITTPLPSAPVWISFPGTELRGKDSLPAGIRLVLSELASADRVVITLGPAVPGIEAHMEAVCRTPEDAKALAGQLRSATALLKEAQARNKQTEDDEIVATLTGGSFDQSDRKVTGKWPVRKTLLDSLTAGL